MSHTEAAYEVERVIDRRRSGDEAEYKIKWTGFDEPTWEPLDTILDCIALVQDFELEQHNRVPDWLPKAELPCFFCQVPVGEGPYLQCGQCGRVTMKSCLGKATEPWICCSCEGTGSVNGIKQRRAPARGKPLINSKAAKPKAPAKSRAKAEPRASKHEGEMEDEDGTFDDEDEVAQSPARVCMLLFDICIRSGGGPLASDLKFWQGSKLFHKSQWNLA